MQPTALGTQHGQNLFFDYVIFLFQPQQRHGGMLDQAQNRHATPGAWTGRFQPRAVALEGQIVFVQESQNRIVGAGQAAVFPKLIGSPGHGIEFAMVALDNRLEALVLAPEIIR